MARPRLFVEPFPTPPASLLPTFGGGETPVFVLLHDFHPGVNYIILMGKPASFSSTIMAILFYECLFPESSFLFVCFKIYYAGWIKMKGWYARSSCSHAHVARSFPKVPPLGQPFAAQVYLASSSQTSQRNIGWQNKFASPKVLVTSCMYSFDLSVRFRQLLRSRTGLWTGRGQE